MLPGTAGRRNGKDTDMAEFDTESQRKETEPYDLADCRRSVLHIAAVLFAAAGAVALCRLIARALTQSGALDALGADELDAFTLVAFSMLGIIGSVGFFRLFRSDEAVWSTGRRPETTSVHIGGGTVLELTATVGVVLCLIAIVGVVAGHLLIVAEVLVTAGFLAGAAAAGAVYAHIRQR